MLSCWMHLPWVSYGATYAVSLGAFLIGFKWRLEYLLCQTVRGDNKQLHYQRCYVRKRNTHHTTTALLYTWPAVRKFLPIHPRYNETGPTNQQKQNCAITERLICYTAMLSMDVTGLLGIEHRGVVNLSRDGRDLCDRKIVKLTHFATHRPLSCH